MPPEPSTSHDDYPNRWRIRVRGHPARVKDIRWREAIRDEVKATYPQAPFAAPPLKTKFDVEVIFRSDSRGFGQTGLRSRQLRQACPRHTLHIAERLAEGH